MGVGKLVKRPDFEEVLDDNWKEASLGTAIRQAIHISPRYIQDKICHLQPLARTAAENLHWIHALLCWKEPESFTVAVILSMCVIYAESVAPTILFMTIGSAILLYFIVYTILVGLFSYLSWILGGQAPKFATMCTDYQSRWSSKDFTVHSNHPKMAQWLPSVKSQVSCMSFLCC